MNTESLSCRTKTSGECSAEIQEKIYMLIAILVTIVGGKLLILQRIWENTSTRRYRGKEAVGGHTSQSRS